ncbi:MAG TPA: tryptophan synthase subunit alpha [Candidatus Krumholzibacteria bacterium]|nr:tryptophan synthase subunit alpha [Candidatus Krumholzibacteria bacterium]
MSTLLSRLCADLRAAGTPAVVPFLTAGYPDAATTRLLLGEVAAAGCRIVEIGVPFSDPVADGPAIQLASRQALDGGMTLAGSIALAGEAARDHGLAPVLMGYLNPILSFGAERFAAACADAGVAGVIVPDLPLEEAAGLRALLLEKGISLVDLVAPTSGDRRLEAYGREATGFLYLVSTTGVTGAGVGRDIAGYVARARARCALPLFVGFGIADAASAARVARAADGVIIGSALQRVVAAAPDGPAAAAAVRAFLAEVTAAVAACRRD